MKFCRKKTGGKLLCSQHKKQYIIYIITLIITVLITFLPKLSEIVFIRKIIITPKEITISNREWTNTTPITVTYRGNKPIYSVWIKISIKGEINSNSIIISIPDFDMYPEVKFSKYYITNKVFQIVGIDSDNNEAIYLVLDKMNRDSDFDFSISGKETQTNQYGSVQLKILSYNNNPSSLIHSKGIAGFTFTPPETFTIKGTRWRMRREELTLEEKYCKEGDKLFENHEYDSAIIKYKKAIDINPRIAEFHNKLGRTYCLKKDFKNGQLELERSLVLDSNYSNSYLQLGMLFSEIDSCQEAIKMFEKYLSLDTNYLAGTLVLYATSLVHCNKEDSASLVFQKLISLRANYAEGHYNYGLFLLRRKKIKEAIVQFEKVISLDHWLKLDSYGMLGLCFEEQKIFDKAISYYNKIIEIAPNSIQANKARNSIKRIKNQN